MKKYLVQILLLSVFWCCGCGDDGNSTCNILVSCQATTMDQCNQIFGAMVLSASCEDAIRAAACEEHMKTEPSYFDLCFPTCTGAEVNCSGDQISGCKDGRTYVFDCSGVCKYQYQEKSYVGSCGSEYNGQPSPTGQDVCWCQ